MSCWLRQSTAVDVMLGPFLDSTDGNTIESGLTITQPDIRLSKNGGAFAQKSAAQTLTHGENGWFPANLSGTDTNTLGVLIVAVHESGALPVWREFLVVPANVYDSFFSTDLLQVDLTQWRGSTPNILQSGLVPIIVDAVNPSTINNAALAADSGLKPIRSGTCQDGANGSVTLDAGASSVTDFYKGTRIYLTAGTGVGQSRLCTGYNGTTKVATIEPNWITNPGAAATNFVILEDAVTLAIATGGIKAATMASDMNTYTTRTWLAKQSTDADKYIVQWVKNGQIVTSGITLPKIRVYDETGADLIAETAMTEIGSTQSFRFEEAINKLTPGEIYMVEAKATIDGAVQMDRQPVMRDSA